MKKVLDALALEDDEDDEEMESAPVVQPSKPKKRTHDEMDVSNANGILCLRTNRLLSRLMNLNLTRKQPRERQKRRRSVPKKRDD